MAPPMPLQASGTPACVTMFVVDDIAGTLDVNSGESEIDMPLQRWRVHLGVAEGVPCPTCGTVDHDPEVGDVFTCGSGSPNPGATCSVHAVSPRFGGTSYDCPPMGGANVSGQGIAVTFGRITTRTRVEQAVLPCAAPLDQLHPDVGQAFCLDDFSSCNTNADCLRCTDTLSACTTNDDCALDATCEEAPVQPIACGVYCHCGFCGGTDVDRPCFSDADCDVGVRCLAGENTGFSQPQAKNNDCVSLICGDRAPEQCCSGGGCLNAGTLGSTPLVGTCSDAPFRTCANNAACAFTGSGECELRPRQCFENLIARTGQASTLTTRCVDEPLQPACTTNAECTLGECGRACPRPVYSALACLPPTASAGINTAAGIPGPIAVTFNGLGTPPATVGLPTTTTNSSQTTTTTNTTTTSLPGGCPLQPRSGCLTAEKPVVAIKNRRNPDKNKLVWKWLGGAATDQADYADPTSTTEYTLCIYDHVAGTPGLSGSVAVPSGASWTDRGPKGYTYKDSAAQAVGVRLVRLRTGADTSARIVFKGRGAGLSVPTPVSASRYFEQSPSVTIELVATNGSCWSTAFAETVTRSNSPTRFAASSP
jgi:hypothetical protein